MGRLLHYGELPLVILSCLAQGSRSSYQLLRDVEDRFDGRYRPSTGALYPAVSGLEHAGLIASDPEASGVFVLTDAGRKTLMDKAGELTLIEARTGARVQPRDRVSSRLREFVITASSLVDEANLATLDAVLNDAVASLRRTTTRRSCRA
jgi:DNA-binding PadR family transcriptional regulator